MSQAKYLYCIIGHVGRKSFGNIGIRNNSEVYTIHYGDISAVVSETLFEEYEPNEENILAHEKVVERVMSEHTVLPVGFGNIFINEDKVKWLLAKFYLTFKTHLKRLESKVEVGVKVFYDIEAAKREVEGISGEAKRLGEEMSSKYDREAHFLKEKLDTMMEREALKVAGERAYKYGVEIYETLKNCAEDTHLMKRIGGDMIVNGAFLVHRDRIAEFEGELEKVKKRYESKAFRFQYSGPWPPYNFARIRIGR